MKRSLFFLLPFLLSPLFTEAGEKPRIPDLPPDAESSQYRTILGSRLFLSLGDGLDPIVALGERNLNWLEYINSFRPADQKLSLTSKETQRGSPIDKPNEYNPELIQKKLDELKPTIPAAMQTVLFEKTPFTKEPPVAVADYLLASRELDRVYQSALRWRTMSPWLSQLASRRHNDLRGWYFLSRLNNRTELFKNFPNLDEKVRLQLRNWLANLCFNSDRSDNISSCIAAIDALIKGGKDLEAYFQSKARTSAKIYSSYFDIPEGVRRPEVRWETNPKSRVIAQFQDPGREDVRAFLQVNIEDEWRYGEWQLTLPFVNSSEAARVEFLPGVTPHVNGLGGDTITMNANQPITEYDAQWTIRHEYGHVLGFPDCYVEFYEKERNVIVNYQFDIDNLMCSRRGHIQEKHVEELKRAYSR